MRPVKQKPLYPRDRDLNPIMPLEPHTDSQDIRRDGDQYR
jgi:hypothetical protein